MLKSAINSMDSLFAIFRLRVVAVEREKTIAILRPEDSGVLISGGGELLLLQPNIDTEEARKSVFLAGTCYWLLSDDNADSLGQKAMDSYAELLEARAEPVCNEKESKS